MIRDEITFIHEHQHPEIMVEVVSHGVNISKINVTKKKHLVVRK